MPNPEIILIGLLIAVALGYMARRTWRKYKIGGGCGSRGKAKNVSLTIGGEPVRKR